MLDAMGCDPFKGMADIALDPAAPIELRGRMHAELAQYCQPKLRSTEHAVEVTHRYIARVPESKPALIEWRNQHSNPTTTMSTTPEFLACSRHLSRNCPQPRQQPYLPILKYMGGSYA